MPLYALALLANVLFSAEYSSLAHDLDNPVENTCLMCICQALSNCNPEEKCDIVDEFSPCGPFHLTKRHWVEARSKGDFKSCATSMHCSNLTIQAYMKRNSNDCNNNGLTDCGDFFRIHLYGVELCHDPEIEETFSWLKLMECYLNEVPNPREALERFKKSKFIYE